MTETIKKIEAILFAVGRAISEQEISELTQENKNEVHEALVELKKQYESRDAPLLIVQEGDSWKLTVHEKYVNVVHQITPHTELSKAMLETLAVIAWKQPATQSEIVKIRTNKAYEHIAELEKMGYVAKHKHGRTYLIKVTGKFYDYFDLPEGGIKEIFKDVKDVEEAQTKLFEEAPKEHVGKLEVFEVPEDEKVKEIEFEETEVPEEKAVSVEDFLEENKVKPAPQEIEEGLVEEKEQESEEAEEKTEEKEKESKEESSGEEESSEKTEEQEERELDPELEAFAKEKKKKNE